MSKITKFFDKIYDRHVHRIAAKSKKYYYEDFVRVYPDGIVLNKYGRRKKTGEDDIKNFINHSKFYKFVTQFVKGKKIADIGCGSGYGCEILKKAGAAQVHGSDLSEVSIDFASKRYGEYAKFSVQGITDLSGYTDNMVDISISSEVLEHVKEYGVEDDALKELRRVTCDGGLIIIGTPNSELLGNHGFSFKEIDALFKANFAEFYIFENALIPYADKKQLWQARLDKGETGIIITENINLTETVIPKDTIPEIKKGLQPGKHTMGELEIDTSLLHNTHSWVVVARNSKH